MKKQKLIKMNLNPSDLAQYLIENINMTSVEVPVWLCELNHGNVDPDVFDNTDDFEREDVIEMFDNALTAVWLFLVTENDTGEISLETNEYEAMRRCYIMTVQQRLDTVYDLANTPLPNIRIKPFQIFWDMEVKIHVSKIKKSVQQELVTKALVSQKKIDEKGINLPN
ncbi:MAG: hypothetical protein KAW56_00650 [Candidatus Marinimicrobia bacterium]|nr:hypothetical protein [Candidatus Neomarinimicrobiota bacterium]